VVIVGMFLHIFFVGDEREKKLIDYIYAVCIGVYDW